jgi:hypothetical protein
MILAITTFFKPMTENDAIASDPLARFSIAGTMSWVREGVDFSRFSLRPDYGEHKVGASVVNMG